MPTKSFRDWTPILFVVGLLALFIVGCITLPTANPPGEKPTAVAIPFPTRLPPIRDTRLAPVDDATLPLQPFLRLELRSPAPLYGTPPFTATFKAVLSGNPVVMGKCRGLHWRFGDGTEETQPCPTDTGVSHTFEATHTYSQAGTYHAFAAITVDDGRAMESDKTQTIVLASPQSASPTEWMVFWGAWGAALVAATVAFLWARRQARRTRTIGYAAIVLGLVSFLPPFSYLPNPLGLFSTWQGSYAYDPRLPFANRFIVADDPTSTLRPLLDGLVGQTGLEPLDPVQPFVRYEFVRVELLVRYRIVRVATRMTYADGSERTFNIPLYHPNNIFGYYHAGPQYDGLGRLRTEHRALSSAPFATAASSVRLSIPQSLTIQLPAQLFDADNLANWTPDGPASQRLAWSPQGDAFLATRAVDYDPNDLWLLRLDGSPPLRLAQNVRDYAWSPDGHYIVFVDGSRYSRVHVISRDGSPGRVLIRDDSLAPPGLTEEGIWYAWKKALWIAPYDDSPPRQAAPLRDLTSAGADWVLEQIVVRPAPDGQRLAYSCETKLCLQDRDGSNWIRTAGRVSEATWNPSGTHLAAVEWDYGQGLVLSLVRRDGAVERQIPLAPSGSAAPPQWTPDGRRLFVNTFPYNGRRIITVDIASGEVLDLSQPRWDAWFSLAPDGKRLLLTNGRGGFWTSDVAYDNSGGKE